ncbi:MAG: cation-translocating P-type ATPase [Anaerolineales bacterium]|nr:cation-translocating P-type ATPase [Anaerolineales bacterium]
MTEITPPKAQEIHSNSVEDLVNQLDTHIHKGLGADQARERLEKVGPNELKERPRPGFLHLLLAQFNNFLIMLLIVAAGVSMLLGEYVDAAAILAIVVLNAVLGVVQESRAEKALAALRKMAAPNAMIVRDGAQMLIPSRELVPGDIVLLEAGNYVPADLRLVESVNLKIDESALTGESQPVHKDSGVVLDKDIPIGDRTNSAFMSSMITYGRGRGLVVATGMHTQIGMIAQMLQTYEEEPTPLQRRLDDLARTLGVAALAICGGIFLYGILRDTSPGVILAQGVGAYLAAHRSEIVELFMTAVSLAIAAVPEGLPAVVTICLALGMQRMVGRHALIRKLAAVETLGSATVICSDKTGTLTQNEMAVTHGWVSRAEFTVEGTACLTEGCYRRGESAFEPARDPDAFLLLRGAALCNDARLEESGESEGEKTWRMIGDPTEGALLVAAAKAGLQREALEREAPRAGEVPFDSARKRMTTIHPVRGKDGSGWIAFMKGAPDVVLDLCTRIREDGSDVPLTPERKQAVLDANHGMARRALRVLSVACRSLSEKPDTEDAEGLEREMVFVGMLGMIDPPRPEVAAAIRTARAAGLRTVMVTGDYPDTARAIGEQINLLGKGQEVLPGSELDALSDAEISDRAERVGVYARVSPQHKVKIVEALKSRGHVVAMTGDGVNDAPALKRSDIGIAMGITGTDVSKETADMVLTDDNYVSIVSAIEEGRIIYSNIRKFVYYLISCNIGEILIVLFSMVGGLPLPLRPIQLLWLNLVTDGAPALALGMEKGEPDVMRRPPRPPKEPIINREMTAGIAVQALVMTAAVLSAFLYGLQRYPGNLAGAQTVAFATLVLSELLRAYTVRSERMSVFQIGLFTNRWMQAAVVSSLLLLLAVIYIPFFDPIFNTVALDLQDWLVLFPFALASSLAAELMKGIFRRGSNARRPAASSE